MLSKAACYITLYLSIKSSKIQYIPDTAVTADIISIPAAVSRDFTELYFRSFIPVMNREIKNAEIANNMMAEDTVCDFSALISAIIEMP